MADYSHFLNCGGEALRPESLAHACILHDRLREIIEALHGYYGEEYMDKARDLLRKNYPGFFPERHRRSAREDLPLSGARESSPVI